MSQHFFNFPTGASRAGTVRSDGRLAAQRLINTGNSCFLNSVVQALSSIEQLHEYVNSVVYRNGMDIGKPDISLSRRTPAAYHLMDTMRSLIVPVSEAIRPPLGDLKPIQQRFLTGQQQDAHEFLSFLLEHLETEHLRPVISRDSEFDFTNTPIQRYKRGTELKQKAARRQQQVRPTTLPEHMFAPGLFAVLKQFQGSTSPAFGIIRQPNPKSQGILHLQNPLSGLLESTLYCPYCDTEWSTMQKMLNLSLYPPASGSRQSSISLDDCLRAFAAPEEVEGVWCSTCDQKRTVLKRMTIARCPRVLCLHIHRIHASSNGLLPGSGPSLRKTSTHVRFPTNLTIGPYTAAAAGSLSRPAPRGRIPSMTKIVRSPSPMNLMSVERAPSPQPPLSLSSAFFGIDFSSHFAESATISTANSAIMDSPPSSRPISRTSSLNSVDEAATFSVMRCKKQDAEAQLFPHISLSPNVAPSAIEHKAHLVSDDPATTDPSYELKSVIVHIGSESGGHYIAFKRLDQNLQFSTGREYDLAMMKRIGEPASMKPNPEPQSPTWVRISDDKIDIVEEAFVLRTEAYMLFYERQ